MPRWLKFAVDEAGLLCSAKWHPLPVNKEGRLGQRIFKKHVPVPVQKPTQEAEPPPEQFESAGDDDERVDPTVQDCDKLVDPTVHDGCCSSCRPSQRWVPKRKQEAEPPPEQFGAAGDDDELVNPTVQDGDKLFDPTVEEPKQEAEPPPEQFGATGDNDERVDLTVQDGDELADPTVQERCAGPDVSKHRIPVQEPQREAGPPSVELGSDDDEEPLDPTAREGDELVDPTAQELTSSDDDGEPVDPTAQDSEPVDRSTQDGELVDPTAQGGDAELPSAGSRGHEEGLCTPCFFWLREACNKGAHCAFCHLHHPCGKQKRMRPSKKTRRRWAKQSHRALLAPREEGAAAEYEPSYIGSPQWAVPLPLGLHGQASTSGDTVEQDSSPRAEGTSHAGHSIAEGSRAGVDPVVYWV